MVDRIGPGSEQGKKVGCENSNEHSGSMECGKFRDQLSN
jgi:hypothetical protein